MGRRFGSATRRSCVSSRTYGRSGSLTFSCTTQIGAYCCIVEKPWGVKRSLPSENKPIRTATPTERFHTGCADRYIESKVREIIAVEDRHDGKLALERAQPSLLINSPDLQDGRRYFDVKTIDNFKVLTLSQVWVNHLATEVSLTSNRAGNFTLGPCEHRRMELWDGDLLTAVYEDDSTRKEETWMVEFEGGIYQEHHIGEVEGGGDDYAACKREAKSRMISERSKM